MNRRIVAPHLSQPGPAQHPRLVSFPARIWQQEFELEPGLSLLHAVAAPLRQSGVASAVLELQGGRFGPFTYVLPAHAPDSSHAAWYSAPHTPNGGAELERANITFGERDGKPWLHCHAVWHEDEGRRAGHVLPEETTVAAPMQVRAWCLADAGFRVVPDGETNFALFEPIMHCSLSTPQITRSAAVLRIRPNENLTAAVEATCRHYGFAKAVIRGGVGSLVSPRFASGHAVADIATEFLVTEASVSPTDGAVIHATLAGMDGWAHEGLLLCNVNSVCITSELVLEEIPATQGA